MNLDGTGLDDDVQVDSRAWPTYFGGSAHPAVGSRLRRSIFVVFLVPDVVQGLRLGLSAVGTVGLAVAYGGAYVVAMWSAWRWPPRWRLVWIALLFALGLSWIRFAAVVECSASLGFCLAAALFLLPLAIAQWIGLATIGGALLAGWVLYGEIDWLAVLIVALVFVTVRGITQMNQIVTSLRAARSEVRVLAVANERARLARDLHDVLGHSLTTITVKTALARRLLESGAQSDRVRAELLDTEELARRTLSEVRATVSGQRRVSLAAELVAARAALRAAGIEADLPTSVDNLAPGLAEPMAYVLREAVTNVVRHSGAARCTVRMGDRWLEVADDGPDPDGAAPVAGNGLTGLRERLAAVGGTLQVDRAASGGIRLIARVPQ
jgi:two-component system sensor histidine kinase DesK